jgi:hypothetical protein
MAVDRRAFLVAAASAAGVSLAGRRRAFAAQAVSPAATGWDAVDAILANIRPPVFPDRRFPITDYGARAEGRTDATQAIARAIQACSTAGGGHVVVPAGTFLTGAVHLASHVDLHLEDGATLKFVQDPRAYLPVVFTRFEGVELPQRPHRGRDDRQLADVGDPPGVVVERHRARRDDFEPRAEQRRLRSGILPRRPHRALHVRHGRRLHRDQIRPQ